MSDFDDALRAAAEAGEPTELATARLIRRAERTLDAPARPVRRAPLVLVGVAAGAALTLFGVWAATPAPRPAEPVALTSSTPTLLPVGSDVALTYAGRGELVGGPARPRIAWESGELVVEVVPERGVDLVVETPEGTAAVVGTGFTVTRDALGTAVHVRHGTVAVRCHDGREARLGADQSIVCLPVRASGMMARAKALDDAGAAPSLVLDALDAGLRLHPDDGPIRAELAARRIRTLARLGRDDEAAAAAAWLAGDEALRRDEVRGLATGLALRRDDCATALSLSEPLPPLDAPTLIALAACAEPPRARALLLGARAADPRRAADIDARLERLASIP
ncbi:MAG: FecR domain-containing protein [Pseudomonadota bacterium]|nr:FecR domain-containing protein [Pseudomonadota bacterium]